MHFHVLALGNAINLYNYLPKSTSNVWIEGTDALDAELAFLWSVWSVADILETRYEKYSDYYNAGTNIRKLSLQYFADNINSVVERNFQPVNPIGEEDLDHKEERFKKMKESFPREITPKFNIYDLPEENRPALYIGEPAGIGDLLVGLLPLESGLQGPIGGLIDLLLEIFIDKVGDEIQISEGAVEQIELAFEVIESLLGFFQEGDLSPESALFQLLELLKDVIPFSDQLLPYVELLLQAIPLLRGDYSAISTVFNSLLDLLLPEELLSDLSFIRGIVDQVLNVTTDVVTILHNEGGSFLDALLSAVSEGYLNTLINKFLNDTLGLSVTTSQLKGYVTKVSLFFRSIMDFLARFDLKKMINNYLPNLLELAIGAIDQTLAEEYGDKIGVVLNLIMSAIGFVDFNLAEVLDELFELFGLGLSTTQAKGLIEKINTLVSQAKETAETSVSSFKTNLVNGINEVKSSLSFSIDPDIQNLIVSTSTMIAGALNSDFTDKNNLPDLNETLDLVITIVGGIATPIEGEIIKDISGKVGSLSAIDRETVKGLVNGIVSLIGLITDKDEIKQFIGKTVSKFDQLLKDPSTLMQRIITLLVDTLSPNPKILETIKTFSNLALTFYKIINEAKDNSIQGILQALVEDVGLSLIRDLVGVDIGFVEQILTFIFPKFFGTDSAELPSATQLINDLVSELDTALGNDSYVASLGLPGISTLSELKTAIQTALNIVFNAKDIFVDGLRWLFGQLMDWVGGQIEQLINLLMDAISSALNDSDLLPPEWDGTFGVGLGSFSLFEITIELGLYPHFGFDENAFSNWMLDIVFGGLDPFQGDIGDFFKKIFSFFELIPTFKAGIELGGFGTEENPLMALLLTSLGLELEFSGGGWFEIELFTLKNGVFDTENFFKVIEWGFSFSITLSKTFTILDFFTAGVGGGVLNAVGKYIGLDAITITISFGIAVEVVKRAASATGPEEGSFTLKITLGAAVHFGIDLLIVGIAFDGSLEIILTFFQDLVADTPLRIFLEIIVKFGVTLTFLFTDWTASFTWKPLSPSPKELTPTDPKEQKANGAMGLDADGDGLSDEYENNTPGLNPFDEDTDGDKLVDKFETQISKTDPILADSDSDGLDDFVEYHNTKTNPLQPDSDWDGLSDYEEAIIIGTDPLDTDTDEDGVDDYYEVNHAHDITGITPSVPFVMIGGKKYFDRTDPLNPDTDQDGLLDGEEGEFGPYYGLPGLADAALYNKTSNDLGQGNYDLDTPPIIFNGGYTSPLDNDTDDDSWEQLWDGKISASKIRLWVKIKDGSYILTSDWWEVKGMPIVYMIEGEPVLNVTYTNPVNPDTDGDTGIGDFNRTRPDVLPGSLEALFYEPYHTTTDSPPVNEFLNSDGYELSLDPPSDPNDADTDDDGLIDGLEGTLKSDSNHTHYANPDTDGDGLGDLQEVLLGSDPRNPDGDHDLVTDGDEYFKYGTRPDWPDTDYDGLLDGEELYWYHTNPFSVDSDGDRISDWSELYVYFTDPMDEDSDNDRLNDFEELFIYRTKPDDPDTDSEEWIDLNNNGRFDGLQEWDLSLDENGDGVWTGDYIRDGDEVYGTYNNISTDPLMWDTDLDSITYFVVYPGGKIDLTFRASDGDELYYYGTNPTYGDTDLDGISDGWELYLGSGLIPDFTPLLLDPLSNDTDGDTILDGLELMIANFTSLIYPYIGFTALRPYNTSPVLADSDGDILTDSEEIDIYNTRPDSIDTDNDTLIDYDEIFFHLTDPLKNDTDADGLLDANETTAVIPAPFEGPIKFKINLLGPYAPTYPTYADDPDTDDDLLPDGAEIDPDGLFSYGTDPMITDSLVNGTLDGLLFDSDHDGVPDGYEYFGDGPNGTISPTTIVPGGGPFNPDSDHDGLLDGAEWQIYGTNASNWDTDNDTFSDGLEILVGTDPLTFTNASVMYGVLDIYRGGLAITSPLDTYSDITTVTVTATNFTNFEQVNYQFLSGPTDHSLKALNYVRWQHQWQSSLMTLPKGAYLLQVTGVRPDGSEVVRQLQFYIQMDPLEVILPSIIMGGIFGFALTALAIYTGSFMKRKFNWSLDFRKLWRRKKDEGGGL
ncbi:MAG: hypothetical protein ACFFE8_02890 [Candidatus Heimdallarchaeota archaeon]